MRLIDKDALLAYIDVGHLRPPTEICFSELDVKNIVDKSPTIDARPIIRGEWNEDGNYEGIIVCSRCGCEANYISRFEEKFDYDWEENLVSNGYEEIREYIKTNFCPNCGAEMKGE